MVEADVKLIHQTPKTLQGVVQEARLFMADRVNEAVQAQIKKGNNKYTIWVDGRETYHTNAMYYAKKTIQINFGEYALRFAAGVVVQTLQKMIRRYYPNPEEPTLLGDKKNVVAKVRAWICEKGKPSIPVSKIYEVTLTEDQFLAVTVEWPSGVYNPIPLANFLAKHESRGQTQAKQKEKGRRIKADAGSGFYQKAADNIRRRLRATRSRSSIQIIARRIKSPHTSQPLGTKRASGHPRPIPRNLAEDTSWAIVVRPRRNIRGHVQGGNT